ncbi:MAG: glycosyltransferase [Holosporaceae bacterium]|nr:glycosyltransferase [Holosporaceae bacterium]
MISVIIPVYNTERYLRECLDSVIRQSFKDIEIICVDDASTDSCPKILKEYVQKDQRMKIVRLEKNMKLSAARNVGIDAAECEFIVFCDSDDMMHPDMLKILFSEIEKNAADIAICDFRLFMYTDCPSFERVKTYRADVVQGVLVKNLLSKKSTIWRVVWNKIYRRKAIANTRFDVDLLFAVEDDYFNICLLSMPKKVVLISKDLYYYRCVPDSFTKNPHSLIGMFSMVKIIRKIAKIDALSTEIRLGLCKEEFKQLVSCTANHYLAPRGDFLKLLCQVDELYDEGLISLNRFAYWAAKLYVTVKLLKKWYF